MNIAQALARAQTHIEIVHCEDTQEAIDALVSEADGSVDVVAQYGHVDVWGTDEDGGEWRLNVTPLPMSAYAKYWTTVLGSRDAAGLVQEFGLGLDGLDEWLGAAEADAWLLAGGRASDMPDEWATHHATALAELRAAVTPESESAPPSEGT